MPSFCIEEPRIEMKEFDIHPGAILANYMRLAESDAKQILPMHHEAKYNVYPVDHKESLSLTKMD